MEHHKITTTKVSRETFSTIDSLFDKYQEQLDLYLQQLLWWNKRVNLVSRNVSRETVAEHIRHSLMVSALPVFQKSPVILDAGTGGGLPGLPLAITHGDKQFILNDIVSKKCLALKQMIRKIGLQNVRVADSSIEQVAMDTPFLMVSKHAFKIPDLISMSSSLPWKAIVLYKGLDFKEELDGLSMPLQISAYDLSKESEFYRNKALIIIKKGS